MITATVKETVSRGKQIGLFESAPVIVNPTGKELGDLFGEENDKEYVYAGEDRDGNKTMSISLWTKEVSTGKYMNTRFYLIDKERESGNNPGSFQYINALGSCTWAKDEASLPSWFAQHSFRKAIVGEEELHEFMRSWLVLNKGVEVESCLLDKDKLIAGDMSEFQNTINTFSKQTVCQLGTVRLNEKDGKEYQSVYSKKTLPGWYINIFKKGQIPTGTLWQNFISQITDAKYGIKDKYTLELMKPYDPDGVLTSTSAIIVPKPDTTKY